MRSDHRVAMLTLTNMNTNIGLTAYDIIQSQ